jgi:hypothetical protein
MKISTSFVRLLFLTLLVCLPLSPLLAGDTNKLNGTWRGPSTDPKGILFFAEMHIKVAPDGTLAGDIHWTLKKLPRENEQTKIGLTATEFIRGRFDTQCRVFSFEGYRKDDPNSIIALDKYRLVLADNNSVMGGVTRNLGNWQGLFSLVLDQASNE